MLKKDFIFLGYIIKKHGFKGEFNIKLNYTDFVKKIDHIFIETNNNSVPFFIQKFILKNKNIGLMKLEDINDENQVKNLIGKKVFLNKSFVKVNNTNKIDLIEYNVFDIKHGEIGKVSEIIQNKSQEILVVKQNKNEIFIPLINKFIIEIKNNTIYLDTPNGLIELYLKQK